MVVVGATVVAVVDVVGGVVVAGDVEGDVRMTFVVGDGVVESTMSDALESFGLLNRSLLEHDPTLIRTTVMAYRRPLRSCRSVLIGCVQGTW
jgi:hypothetical protein